MEVVDNTVFSSFLVFSREELRDNLEKKTSAADG